MVELEAHQVAFVSIFAFRSGQQCARVKPRKAARVSGIVCAFAHSSNLQCTNNRPFVLFAS